MQNIKENDMALLGRKRIKFEIEHLGASTPSKNLIKEEIAKKYSTKPELVAIRHIYTKYGQSKARIIAHIYKDEKMAELVGKTVNWYMTHGLAENICAHFAAKMGEPGLRAWEDEEELAKELRWLDSGDIDKEYKEKYWDACKDKEFYREKAKAIFGRGNFARPVVSVEQIATILTKCKSIFKNPHHYSMDEQGKMVMDDARLIHDLHNRSGWHIRRCEICGLVYQYDTSD